MFVNRMPRYEILSEDAIAVLDKGWRRIISELGIEFMHPEALELFRGAGQRVEDNTVFLDPDFVLEQVAKAPTSYDVQARNPARSIHLGGDHMNFAGVYGPPFVREGASGATPRCATSSASASSPSPSTSSTPPAAPSSSRTTRRSTRATSTWSSGC